jgi:hypothetical protein
MYKTLSQYKHNSVQFNNQNYSINNHTPVIHSFIHKIIKLNSFYFNEG